MRFTKLRLNGFKSFVDPTDLVIADGLTGVVGPNGCGKSNLLEALRWVMGENRPTAMRGGGMEDVIFAGTSSRPARNHAEVSLVIDNAERLAPAGFNDSDLLEITRRITRDVGSAYKVGPKDVRARDVQMLFADASTGAHSPALVRQGQISELINAKPKARRRILEEAAGISGLYQRRHEAELKLKGAEQNLARVDDVIEQLAAQLTQLARQARQAMRYRDISASLRHSEGVLLYRRWHEAEAARAAAETALRSCLTEAAGAERAAREAVTAREAAEAGLPPRREEESIATAVLQRLQVERDTLSEKERQAVERITSLTARIDQLGKDMSRESALNTDAGDTIARLDAEAAELRAAGDGYEAELSTAMSAAQEAAAVLAQREEDLSELTEGVARLAARHQSARRLIEDHSKTVAKSEAEAARAAEGRNQAKQALGRAEAELVQAQAAEVEAQTAVADADTALTDAEAQRSAAQSRESDARAQHSEAEGEAGALRAEVNALTRLVEREASDQDAVLDQLRVSEGYEAALGAALADDLRAPVIGSDGVSGWAELPGYGAPQMLPDGIQSLGNFVTVPGVLARRISQIGLVEREQGAALQAQLAPGQRLVSLEGDLWRWDGYRAGAEDAPSAAALRLQQLNRLVSLKRDLEEASARAEGTRLAHESLTATLTDLTAADQAARKARRDADSSLAEAQRKLSRAEADLTLAEGRLESLALAVTRHEEEATAARQALREAEGAASGLGDLEVERARVDDIKMTVEAARMTMMAKRSAHDELKRDGEARTRRAAQVEQEVTSWRKRLANASARSEELGTRKSASEAELQEAEGRPAELAAQREALADQIDAAETRRKNAADALAVAETALRDATGSERDAERAASEAREARAAAEARRDAAGEVVVQAAERIDEALETTPDKLFETLEIELERLPDAEAIEAEVNRLKRQRDALGAVNLRADEDAKEVQAEHDELVSEKSDLEEAIRTLRSGISALNREGRERLLTAFEQVNENFGTLFKHLFGGGEAKLMLIESDDPLEAGLEIMCQPPGKKLSTLSLLSGGEQTLTAMALIFAVFITNPAPICVLDEVDAPLDDANVGRFCDLLDEMTRRTETRFLIITHHAVTMSRMDRLFGVTMGEQGVSQLVSVDLKKAEALVA